VTRLGIAAEICIIIAAPLVVLALFPQLQPFAKMYPQIFENKYLATASFFAMYAAILALSALAVALGVQAAQVLYMRGRKTEINANVLGRSVPEVGGRLYIEGDITGRFVNGFASITFRTQYGDQDRVFLFYDKDKAIGRLHGDKVKEPFALKWKIPEDFADGDLRIHIEVYDVQTSDIIKETKSLHPMGSWSATMAIAGQKSGGIEIQKMMQPSNHGLRKFDSSAVPMSGWVCVKLYNDSDTSYKLCIGRIRTDAGVFPLYDYERINGAASDGRKATTFSIEPNSTKLLCANIISRTPRGKVHIDIGKEEIVRELEVEED
jgi:hypothetical protein